MRGTATRRLLLSARPRPATHRLASCPAPRHASSSTSPKPRRTPRALPILAVAVAAAAAYSLSSRASSSPATLNDETFVPYTIAAKEDVSPTSFILTLRPPQHRNASAAAAPYLQPGTALWKFPQWSVEFKQPELQIARHYTPLPPDAPAHYRADEPDTGALRFYVRALPAGGEMSSYLGRLRAGAHVWLRGPHPGFDILGRLGTCPHVVFLAGGTGLAPGMQVAQAVLDARPAARVTLLWAVRHRSEMQRGAARSAPWWSFWRAGREPHELEEEGVGGEEEETAVAAQLVRMKRRYGERLRVRVAVDDEAMCFRAKHLLSAVAADGELAALPGQARGEGCQLHDPAVLEHATEYEDPEGLRCVCSAPTGKNLFIVSGPEGFVEHYAGAKVWRGGVQLQGPVGGVVGGLARSCPGWNKDWLVLKL